MSAGRRDDDEDEAPGYASPPCFLHEVDPAYMGAGPAGDLRTRQDVMRWRKAERQRLIEARLALAAAERRRLGGLVAARLAEEIGDPQGLTVSAYWPIRGEPDLRPLLEDVAARGGQGALPVVVAQGRPLVFRAWAKGEPLEPGVWNIPVPREGAEVVPDVVIAPVVGFDGACYRLGFGGGFFDRTLAALPRRPRVIGVGYELAALATIYPLPHDIAMDAIVTESRTLACDRA